MYPTNEEMVCNCTLETGLLAIWINLKWILAWKRGDGKCRWKRADRYICPSSPKNSTTCFLRTAGNPGLPACNPCRSEFDAFRPAWHPTRRAYTFIRLPVAYQTYMSACLTTLIFYRTYCPNTPACPSTFQAHTVSPARHSGWPTPHPGCPTPHPCLPCPTPLVGLPHTPGWPAPHPWLACPTPLSTLPPWLPSLSWRIKSCKSLCFQWCRYF